MAAVTTTQAHTSLTPPSSSHGQDSWSYSVPAHPEPSPTAEYQHGRQFSQTNGYGMRPSTDTFGARGTESNYLAPARVNALNRHDSSISDTPSAPDSLLEMYGNNKYGHNNMDSADGKDVNGEGYEKEDPENSRWIHRDKLAKIESEELQAAGIVLPRPRTASRSSRRSRSRDQPNGQRRQRVGTFSAEEIENDPHNAWDLRLPEEAAEDNGHYRDLGGKPISRIPVSKTSPLPIPMDYLERDTPIARKASGNWYDDETASISKVRGRSHSVKSSFALDEATNSQSSAPVPMPTGASTPARKSPIEASPTKKTHKRKGSIGANAALPSGPNDKPRQTSTQRHKQKSSTSDPRPKTRPGESMVTSSNKRPEGDPPWLATMYKPDPRLPPDQQVIPTHAKRMQQEQWEKEGKFGNVYDTSFRLLNQEEYRPRPNSLSPPPDAPSENEEPKPEAEPEAEQEQAPEWPLSAQKSPKLSEPPASVSPVSPVSPMSPVSPVSPRSPTLSTGGRSMSGAAGGSYSTMPKIHTGKPQGVNIPDPKPSSIRVPDTPESGKKGCCAVM
ncbi:40s ribosomal s12 protein [Rutstroemia sp. NJR-2017a WRK4]|nr:40s ribosomal s12 protein [Rutstroemia sp. NJR-2017a WRK4]